MTAVDRHCRVGRVRLKGGAELRVLPSRREKHHADVMAHAARITTEMGRALDGTVCGSIIVLWTSDGYYCIDVKGAESNPFPWPMLPTFAADAVRREIGQSDARNQVARMLGLPEPS
jgi:hypothetical protein